MDQKLGSLRLKENWNRQEKQGWLHISNRYRLPRGGAEHAQPVAFHGKKDEDKQAG